MKLDAFSIRNILDKTAYFKEQKEQKYFTKDIILTYKRMYV